MQFLRPWTPRSTSRRIPKCLTADPTHGCSSTTGKRPSCFYTNVGPVQGPAFDRGVPPTIEVLRARFDPQPIGMALCVGSGIKGIALWRLIVRDVAVPGRWVLIDRQFRPADPERDRLSGPSA